jgi:hypothetical protein
MTPVAACERQGIEQPRHTMIEDGAVVAACLVAENAWLATRWPLWKTSTVALRCAEINYLLTTAERDVKVSLTRKGK